MSASVTICKDFFGIVFTIFGMRCTCESGERGLSTARIRPEVHRASSVGACRAKPNVVRHRDRDGPSLVITALKACNAGTALIGDGVQSCTRRVLKRVAASLNSKQTPPYARLTCDRGAQGHYANCATRGRA